MANLKSSKKDILKNKKNHFRNQNQKSKMKTLLKKAEAAIEQQTETKLNLVKEALRLIDKTAGKGIIKKQTAARKKSRLMTLLNKSLLAKSEKATVTPSKAKTVAKKKNKTAQ